MKYQVELRETVYKFYSVMVETEDDNEDFLNTALNSYSEDDLVGEQYDDVEVGTYVKLGE